MIRLMGPLDYFHALMTTSPDDPHGLQGYDTYEDGSSDPLPPRPDQYVPLGMPLSGLFGSGDESVRVPPPPPPGGDEWDRATLMMGIGQPRTDPNPPPVPPPDDPGLTPRSGPYG